MTGWLLFFFGLFIFIVHFQILSWYELHEACKNNDIDSVVEIIENLSQKQKYLIDLADQNNESPLFHAVKVQNTAIITLLLKNNARITHRVIFGAARSTNRYILELLSDYGADFNVRTEKNWSVLHDTVCLHNNDVIEFLVNHGVSVDSKDIHDTTPICLAASRNNSDALLKFLNLNADVNIANAENYLPLHVAAKVGHCKYLDKLIERTEQINRFTSKSQTPLDLFVSNNAFYKSDLQFKQDGGIDNFASLFNKFLSKGAKINRLARAYRRERAQIIIKILPILLKHEPSVLFFNFETEKDHFKKLLCLSIIDSVQFISFSSKRLKIEVYEDAVKLVSLFTRSPIGRAIFTHDVISTFIDDVKTHPIRDEFREVILDIVGENFMGDLKRICRKKILHSLMAIDLKVTLSNLNISSYLQKFLIGLE